MKKTQDRAEETSSRGASIGRIGTERGGVLFVTVNFSPSVVCIVAPVVIFTYPPTKTNVNKPFILVQVMKSCALY